MVLWYIFMCDICKVNRKLTFHHLRPKMLHSRKKYKKMGKAILSNGIRICQICHSAIHDFWTEKELASSYYTLDLLLETNEIQKHIVYAQKIK